MTGSSRIEAQHDYDQRQASQRIYSTHIQERSEKDNDYDLREGEEFSRKLGAQAAKPSETEGDRDE